MGNEIRIDGFLTTEQAVARCNASGRLRRHLSRTNWTYVTNTRGIKPTTMLGRCNLWKAETVDQLLEIFVNIEQTKLAIVRRNIRQELDDECL